MIITNKKVSVPTSIKFRSQNFKITESYKLLGVTIDNKLNFKKHVSDICLSINRRLFSIKNLFYHSFRVKLQFFKSFLLQCTDYCMSIFIYFSSRLIDKLGSSYNIVLFKLFKIDLLGLTPTQINDILMKFNLFDFNYRLLF